MKNATKSHLKSSVLVLLISAIVFGFYYYAVIYSYDQLRPEAKIVLSNPYVYVWWR